MSMEDEDETAKKFSASQLLCQNKSCSECQQDVRKTERQIEDRKTFQLSYQNKSCSECQQDVKKSVRETDKQEDRQRAEQTDRMTV